MHINNLVSILIPVYNRESLIGETIDSALNQTYKNIEIIIGDNCSTDNTWQIIQEYRQNDSRIKAFQNKTNIGPVKNWKRCIDEASGKYGKILWSDDLIAPDFIEKTVPYLEDHQDVGFVLTGIKLFDDDIDASYPIGMPLSTGIYPSDKYVSGVITGVHYPVSPGCALFRLKDLKKNLLVDIPNKVNSDFSMHAIGPDLLIFLLTAHNYKQFACIEKHLSYFRKHDDSITVSSNNVKLILYYHLATAYFVENYKSDLIKKLNTKILIGIKKHQKCAKKYNLNKIEKFYIENKNFSIDYLFLIKKILRLIR